MLYATHIYTHYKTKAHEKSIIGCDMNKITCRGSVLQLVVQLYQSFLPTFLLTSLINGRRQAFHGESCEMFGNLKEFFPFVETRGRV